MSFSKAVQEALGHYVYAYVDPRDKSIFYVGKGVKNRCEAHLNAAPDTFIGERIAKIRASGFEPRIDIISSQIDDAKTALRVEAALIDALGLPNLANQQSGHGSAERGRMTADEAGTFFGRKPLAARDLKEATLLIRVNQLFRFDMNDLELYEATRGVWVLDPDHAREVTLICAVYRGVVRQVYRPAGPNAWFPAGTTLYKTREVEMDKPGEKHPRWEFVGRVAEEAVLKRFVGRDASDFLAGANPINYVHPG